MAKAYGLVEAARGGLGHWLRIGTASSTKYQIVTPTAWNASPRDSAGRHGHWEQSIIGLPVPDPANPVDIGHIVRSHDPLPGVPCISSAASERHISMSDRVRLLRPLLRGNPLHGDDGYGPAVALALRKQVKCAGADIVDCGNRGLDALHYFENVAHVIVIDAMAGPGRATARLLRPHEVPVESHHGGHGAGLATCSKRCGKPSPHPPLIDVIAAEIGPVTTFVPGLSIEVAAAVAETVTLVCQRFARRPTAWWPN